MNVAPRRTYPHHQFKRLGAIRWSRELAYATGLVATDGYLSEPSFVGFGSRDRELVETFLRCVGRPIRYTTTPAGRESHLGERLITSKYDYYSALASDPALFAFFKAAGLHPRKSRDLGALDVPPDLLSDAVRGLLDGDGSIMTALIKGRRAGKEHTYQRLRVAYYSSSAAHIEWLRAVLASWSIPSAITVDARPEPPSFRLVVADRPAIALLTALYEDSRAPRLTRKWSKWIAYRDSRALPDHVAFL